MSVPSANLTLPILSAWREREELLAQITSLVTITRRVRNACMHKLGAGYKPRVIEQKLPDRRAHEGELGLGTSTLRLHRASLAVCVAALRVATLRVVEAVTRWQRAQPVLPAWRPAELGGPAARAKPFAVRGENVLHALLLGGGARQQCLPLPLATDPLLLRCFDDGSPFGAALLHPASELRRMEAADEALRREARFYALPVLRHRPAGWGGAEFVELELLLYGQRGAYKARLEQHAAAEALTAAHALALPVQMRFRARRRRAKARREALLLGEVDAILEEAAQRLAEGE